MKKGCFYILFFLVVGGCTSIQVTQLDKSYGISHICIENNTKVIVGGFLNVIEDGFQNHGITTEIFNSKLPDHCKYKLTYTALQSWDFTTYLSHAEVRLFERNKRIASAEYHLKGKGGFSFAKWNSVKSKMGPVIDNLLSQYRNE